MTSQQEADGSLVFSYDTRLWSQAAAVATVMFLGTAAYDYFIGRGEGRLIGLFGSAVTMAGIAYVLSERSRFRVDPGLRRIDWEQGFAFRIRRGSIRFDDVRQVSLERPLGDHGVPSRRVILHLANGTQLPLTIGYRPDGDRAITLGAELMRKMLGHSGPGVSDTARLLIDSGKKFDAIRLMMDQEGLSLSDAKKRARQLDKD